MSLLFCVCVCSYPGPKMQTLQVLSLTLLSILAANAQTLRPGKCPQPPVQANFDAARVTIPNFYYCI